MNGKNKHSKYKTSGLNSSVINDNGELIKRLIEEKELYLNHNLKINDISKLLDIPSQYVSQIINTYFGKNYSDVINSYRIEKFIALLEYKINNNEKISISELSYMVGFNSKSTFNRAFSKKIKKSPTEYINNRPK